MPGEPNASPGLEQSVKCASCGTFNRSKAKFCKMCGKALKEKAAITTGPLGEAAGEKTKCPKCGNVIAHNVNFCGSCGNRLKEVLSGEVYRKSDDDQYFFAIGKTTDRGKKREINEDSFSTIEFSISENNQYTQVGLYVVCDGMGGANAGEVASEIAVRCINTRVINEFQRQARGRDSKIDDIIKDAVRLADAEIRAAAASDASRKGMGSTVVMAIAKGKTVFVYNVGDSRCYLVSKKRMKQLSTDHSLLNVLLKKGIVKEKDREGFKGKNVITHALGIDVVVENAPLTIRLEDGEHLLLCSDGLSGYVDEATILKTVTEGKDPQKTVEALVRAANDKGGSDNVTVILLTCSRKP